MRKKHLSFYFDEPKVRSELAGFARRTEEVTRVTKGGSVSWNGDFPERVGDYFYGEPWVLLGGAGKATLMVDLSVFSADNLKTPEQVGKGLEILSTSAGWAIAPWGGYANYGLIALIADVEVSAQIESKAVFQYSTTSDFAHHYRGLIARRTHSELTPSLLWRAVASRAADPLIVTFEYDKDLFDYDQGLYDRKPFSFSVEGTFSWINTEPPVSVYRIRDYDTFKYFVGMISSVSVFDILPGEVGLDSCIKVRQMAHGLDFAGALQHTPWLLAFNGGEIDTYPALFVASEHVAASHFANEMAVALEFVSYF